jgi:hypothetical protein
VSSYKQAPTNIHTLKQVTIATAGTTAVSAEVSKLTLSILWLHYHLCTISATTTGTTTTITTTTDAATTTTTNINNNNKNNKNNENWRMK